MAHGRRVLGLANRLAFTNTYRRANATAGATLLADTTGLLTGIIITTAAAVAANNAAASLNCLRISI